MASSGVLVGIIVGSICGGLLLLALAVAIALWLTRRSQAHGRKKKGITLRLNSTTE